MLITIFVYLYIPELRKGPGKLLVCYLLGLSLGYSTLSIKNWTEDYEIACKTVGYASYYFFLTAFFWLNVISFDIWSNIRKHARHNEHKSFILYSIYAFGGPLIMLIVAIVAQEVKYLHNSYKPGFNPDTGCWLNNTVYMGPLIFFFGPMLLLITANIVMFSLTAYKIYDTQKVFEIQKNTNTSARHLQKNKTNFFLYLRLFIMMGVAWQFELASFFATKSGTSFKIFIVTKYINALQGVLIFVFFILKQKVRKLILVKIFKRNLSGKMQRELNTTSHSGIRKEKSDLMASDSTQDC